MRSALQQAVYDRLSALSVPVYDDVQQSTPMPYVVIGEDALQSADTDDSRGAEGTIEIHVWTDSAGRKQGKDIADAIYTVLHHAQLEVQGYSLAAAFWEESDALDDGDGVIRDVVETYRVLLHE